MPVRAGAQDEHAGALGKADPGLRSCLSGMDRRWLDAAADLSRPARGQARPLRSSRETKFHHAEMILRRRLPRRAVEASNVFRLPTGDSLNPERIDRRREPTM